MRNSIVILILFLSCNLSAQVDSCEQIRQKWEGYHIADINNMAYLFPDTGKMVYHFPDVRKTIPQTKISLWSNTPVFNFRGYQVNNLKLAGWAGLAFAGAVDGIVEGYEFDGRQSFERKYNAAKSGYFGSESWRLAYKNGDVDQGQKNGITKVLGAQDFYHHADDLRKLGYVTGGITLGISGTQTNIKKWHYMADFIIGFAISGATKAAGMYWIRN